MTENEQTAEEVRRALGEKKNGRGYRVFSSEARQLAIAYAKKRVTAGASTKEVSDELGLIGWTMQRWLQNEQRGHRNVSAGFARLEVKAVLKSPVVRGPYGVWVEGLDVAGIAALLRSLSCSA